MLEHERTTQAKYNTECHGNEEGKKEDADTVENGKDADSFAMKL
jgi:hypothetical protein